ncbi:apoptosis facilitator Bcl-2-like protein 14 [Salminus brasiliensis]|uniref:apoptosis facilitator Bcl-2-like protein 14 n=1 Tax=Salminus brasiliensis TaxID=930266 RepID=UPI003B8329CB
MEANISVDGQLLMDCYEYLLLEKYCGRRKSRTREKPAIRPMCAPAPERLQETTWKVVLAADSSADTGEFGDVVENLAHIVDGAPLVPDDVVTDGGESVIQRLVELLKESGDELNERIQRDHELLRYLQNSFSYSVFEKLVSSFIGSVVPSRKEKDDVGEQKTQIAWTFEMTSRLRALDLQPMNRVMGFGAQYLHQNFAQWIQQHGGWEKVFNRDESDDP